MALTFAGCGFHALRLETQPVREHVHRLIELSEQKHLPIFRHQGLIYQGWVQALGGGGEPAIAQLRDRLAEWRAMGHRSGTPLLVLLLAQALQHGGASDEALSAAEEGLALSVEISPTSRAEFCRLKGELLNQLQPPLRDQVQDCFHTAIAEARQHGAKFHELRATASLARLWAGSGRRAEAYQALAEIYTWFSEGFDTPDLRAAKVLLDFLS